MRSWRSQWALAGLALGFALAGCAAPSTGPGNQTSVGSTSSIRPGTTSHSTTSTSSALASFPPGIYYADPRRVDQESPPARLIRVDGPLPRIVNIWPNLYDLRAERVISSDQSSTLFVRSPDGTTRQVKLDGLYFMGRPTSSPDGTHVAVQATEDPDTRPQYGVAIAFAIWVVDLSDGSHHRISSPEEKCESPKWIPGTSHVLFSCFQPDGPGMPKAHVVEAGTGQEVQTLLSAGTLMPGASRDGQYFLNADHLRIYNLSTGQAVKELKDAAVAAVRAAGFELDSLHDGFDHRGSFPLDGDFSPGGDALVFDGAVMKDGQEGLLVMRMNVDGTGFQVLTDLIYVDPASTNNYNYSPLNPRWI